MKSFLLVSLVATAAAFAPSAQHARPSTAVPAAMDDMIGSINFSGSPFKFDPLGLAETYGPLLPWFREAELRHARTYMSDGKSFVRRLFPCHIPFSQNFLSFLFFPSGTAMLAVVGWIVADIVRIPGETYSFENVPSSAAAHDILFAMGVASPMTQLLLFIGLWELTVAGPAAYASSKGERQPGGMLNTLMHSYSE